VSTPVISALSFLTPDAIDAPARSPMHDSAARAGARFAVVDGFEVVTGYADPGEYTATVAFADRSHLVKLELNGPPPRALRPGVAELVDGNWWCPVTPTRTLLLGAASVREAAAASGANVVEVTSGLAAMALIGPMANELLARFCAIDVRPQVTPVAGFRPGSVARTPGYLLKTAEHELLIMVGAALGRYLWEVVADAAAHLGGGPVA
jgi:heterotetrameric sarcosine oxidase gamma subunit